MAPLYSMMELSVPAISQVARHPLRSGNQDWIAPTTQGVSLPVER